MAVGSNVANHSLKWKFFRVEVFATRLPGNAYYIWVHNQLSWWNTILQRPAAWMRASLCHKQNFIYILFFRFRRFPTVFNVFFSTFPDANVCSPLLIFANFEHLGSVSRVSLKLTTISSAQRIEMQMSSWREKNLSLKINVNWSNWQDRYTHIHRDIYRYVYTYISTYLHI